jgi:hypothetical protein
MPAFVWTFNKFVCGNVGAFPPRFQRGPADRAGRVTRMRCQELLFSASVVTVGNSIRLAREVELSDALG